MTNEPRPPIYPAEWLEDERMPQDHNERSYDFLTEQPRSHDIHREQIELLTRELNSRPTWLQFNVAKREAENAKADRETALRERDALRAEVERLKGVIERDRTKAAEIIGKARGVVNSRGWLAEGRGSYSYDDKTYQEEFGIAIREMLEALQPLSVLAADWSDCPKDFQAARVDWKARAEAVESKLAMAREALEFYADPNIYKPHPHGIGFDNRDVSFKAKSTLAALDAKDGEMK
jgi:hypothetical protein